ncbi:MAG: fasciclin domain-containing protein [Pleurocapsa sp.]
MNTKSFRQISQRLLILTGALSIGALSVSPALANNHNNPMEPSSDTGMEMNQSNQSDTQAGSIVDVASENEDFSTLAQAIEAAELTDKLSDSSASYTVFAPTNEAFDQLPEGALDYLLQPENKEVLQRVLSYHVLPEQVASSEISSGEVASLDGGLATDVTDRGVVVNNASVITPDIEASNGVIHAVNQVLLPADLQTILASELEMNQDDIFQ